MDQKLGCQWKELFIFGGSQSLKPSILVNHSDPYHELNSRLPCRHLTALQTSAPLSSQGATLLITADHLPLLLKPGPPCISHGKLWKMEKTERKTLENEVSIKFTGLHFFFAPLEVQAPTVAGRKCT